MLFRSGRALQSAGSRLGAGARAVSLALNLPTLAVLLGVPAWALVDSWSAWMAHRTAAVPPWQVLALSVALWLLAVGWVAQSLVRRRARRFLARVGDQVGEAVEAGLRGRLLDRLEARLDALTGQQRRLTELHREIDGLVAPPRH